MDIISRSEWGARPWSPEPNSVSLSERTEFFVHHDGDTPITRTGNAIPRAIDSQHHNQGWSGIGYNFVVSQAGEVFEGRGWNLQGAHCPNHNRSGFGVQVAIGGDQEPTQEALRKVVELYNEACRRTGRTLAKKGHKDGFATECPGDILYAWVQAGMPVDGGGGSPAPSGSTWARYQSSINGLAYGYGASGDHVTKVGQALVSKGFGGAYREGPGPNWTDADTENYAAFQRSLGYSGSDADGVPGETSLRQLLGYVPSAQSGPPFVHALRYNGYSYSYDDQARIWQAKMAQRTWAIGAADGFYGPHSADICRQFQRRHGLVVDGVVGPKTWAETWND